MLLAMAALALEHRVAVPGSEGVNEGVNETRNEEVPRTVLTLPQPYWLSSLGTIIDESV